MALDDTTIKRFIKQAPFVDGATVLRRADDFIKLYRESLSNGRNDNPFLPVLKAEYSHLINLPLKNFLEEAPLMARVALQVYMESMGVDFDLVSPGDGLVLETVSRHPNEYCGYKSR